MYLNRRSQVQSLRRQQECLSRQPNISEDFDGLPLSSDASSGSASEHYSNNDYRNYYVSSLLSTNLISSPGGPSIRRVNNMTVPLFTLARTPFIEPVARHDLGAMDITCSFCGALHWIDEKLTSSSNRNPKFGLCCDSGKVRLSFTTSIFR